ncbi:trypsin-like serine protease [Sinomonas halotolerans]|uniref:Trypsin-like serine protease n=1 Tax=Sinomonas halotolerans TaxID=1644133 RepID=A0ABU9X257_9MICC
MKTKIAAVTAAIATALGLAVAAGPAQASTGGTPDGETHAGVAMILYYADGGRYRCSAALVSPTVLLTAAHCTDGTDGKTFVTFDSVVAEEPPSGLPAAADPKAGFTEADLAGEIAGTAVTHPDYSGFQDLDSWNDVGVVVLDAPVSGLPVYGIAGLGTLDEIAPGDIPSTIVTAVGYGTEVRKPASGPQKPTPMSYPLIRRYVDMPLQRVMPQVFQTIGNEHDTRGTGGTCFGDSGGPVFLGHEIVGVTSYGLTSNCRYIDGYQRVDIPTVQDWLADEGVPTP